MPATFGQATEPISDWAQRNFGGCDLGDKRRNRRLIQFAEQMSANPSASLPCQLPKWGDLKAAYRLFDCDRKRCVRSLARIGNSPANLPRSASGCW